MMYGATSQNINKLTISMTILSFVGLFFFKFSVTNILISTISFYILNILGNWLMLHRYYAHRSFEFNSKIIKQLLTGLAVLAGRGSPLGWAYIHRQHHAYSDTDRDPHSPNALGYKLFGFNHYKEMESQKMNVFLVKDILSEQQIFIHKYYMLFILSFILCLGLYSIELLYFAWILPVFFVHLSQNNFNYFSHTHGYKNIETTDNSKNNVWLFPILLGEAWHNNHHANPRNFSTSYRKFELDPLSWFINLVKIK